MSFISRLRLAATLWLILAPAWDVFAAPRVNVLFITADDMNFDTPGFAGGRVPGITPNLDRLAAESMYFVNAHVTVGVCQPSRECLMTGRYPQHNGATGFYPVRPYVPTLAEVLKAAGYRLGILGKVTHLKPDAKFPWDYQHDQGDLGAGRDPALYYRYTKEFLAQMAASGRPFFLMANSHDPHRPWAGSDAEKKRPAGNASRKQVAAAKDGDTGDISGSTFPSPDRVYRPQEVITPGFLPDLPNIRKEMAQYFSSAHRCDETVGEILRALKESGLEDSTLVMFLSDNGISMPFAKSNCYFTSTRTPWLVRWPGRVKGGVVETKDFISGIDFMPTILAATEVRAPGGMDGRSFLPLLLGEQQEKRDCVFTCYNDTAAPKSFPMRCLQTHRFGYIFNAWSDGKTRYAAEPLGGLAFAAMKAAAASDPAIAARVALLLYRVPEELFDFAADSDAMHNLAGDPKFRDQLKQMRRQMLTWMEQTQDPLLSAYRARYP
jgi:N-sulfoglucosamine sulfohydrolase